MQSSSAFSGFFRCTNLGCFKSTRTFSVLHRPQPNYHGHVPLNGWEKGSLAAGSAVIALLDPYRGDMIAALGEATATPFFIYRLRDTMLADSTGRRILRDRPRITSDTLPLSRLNSFPQGSVGRAYASWLEREGVDPDTRAPVKHIDDEECAYVMQRYRESHDFYHALTGLPVFVEGEVALKAFEFANTFLPMTALSTFAVTRMKPAERARFWNVYLPWATRNGLNSKDIINIYWEEQLERQVDDVRREIGLEKPPDLRETRRLLRERRKSARQQ